MHNFRNACTFWVKFKLDFEKILLEPDKLWPDPQCCTCDCPINWAHCVIQQQSTNIM